MLVTAFFYFAPFISCIPCSVLIARYGYRRMLEGSLLLSTAGGTILAASTHEATFAGALTGVFISAVGVEVALATSMLKQTVAAAVPALFNQWYSASGYETTQDGPTGSLNISVGSKILFETLQGQASASRRLLLKRRCIRRNTRTGERKTT